jgi:hypothetical protein
MIQSRRELENISGHVSSLANLAFDSNLVSMYHDPETLRKEGIDSLHKANLIPPEEKLAGIISEEDMKALGCSEGNSDTKGKPGRVDSDHPLADILGIYYPSRLKVVVYDKMCLVVGIALGINPRVLRRVVAAHEVSHAVTHMGRHEGDIWKEFAYADRMDLELFAEVYCLFCLRDMKDTVALNAFYRLARHQNFIYNTWKIFADENIELVNEGHLLARRKGRICYKDIEEKVSDISKSGYFEALEIIQKDIDVTEMKLFSYQRDHQGLPRDLGEVAKIMGIGEKYDDLLRKQFFFEHSIKPLEETEERIQRIEREISTYLENHPELKGLRIEPASLIGKWDEYLGLLKKRRDLERDLIY